MHKEIGEKLGEVEKKILEVLCAEIAEKGLECMDTCETGQVVDMIKDLAEAKKNCFKAKYYETVVEAMDDAEEEEELMMKLALCDKMGYTPRRSASTGRYMRPGYVPTYDHKMDDEDYVAQMDWDGPRMGYTPRGNMPQSQYGRPYDEWLDARRNYTETRSPEAKKRMEEHANEHIMASITSLRNIFRDADPETKRRVKQDLSSLVNEMNV